MADARNISEVLPDFLEFIGNDILLGHNIASFDIPIVRRNVAVVMRAMFEPNYIDTMYLAKMVPGVPDHKLQTMLDYYGIVNERAHRAFEDCEATSKLFNALVADGIAPEIRRSYYYTNIEAAQPVQDCALLLPGILSAVPEQKSKQLLPKWALSLLIRYLPKQTILLSEVWAPTGGSTTTAAGKYSRPHSLA